MKSSEHSSHFFYFTLSTELKVSLSIKSLIIQPTPIMTIRKNAERKRDFISKESFLSLSQRLLEQQVRRVSISPDAVLLSVNDDDATTPHFRHDKPGVCSYPHEGIMISIEFSTKSKFKMTAPVYQLKTQDYDPLKVTNMVNTYHNHCGDGGRLLWNHSHEICIVHDFPMVFLEEEHILDFESAQDSFMASFWAVKNQIEKDGIHAQLKEQQSEAKNAAKRGKRRGLRRLATREQAANHLKEEADIPGLRSASPSGSSRLDSSSGRNSSEGSRSIRSSSSFGANGKRFLSRFGIGSKAA